MPTNEEKWLMLDPIQKTAWILYEQKIDMLIQRFDDAIFNHVPNKDATQLQANICARNVLALAKRIPYDIANDATEEINWLVVKYVDDLSWDNLGEDYLWDDE